MNNSPRGSLWHRWDLHFHTPSSFDYHDKSVTRLLIVLLLRECVPLLLRIIILWMSAAFKHCSSLLSEN
jgi:hypothetical protein